MVAMQLRLLVNLRKQQLRQQTMNGVTLWGRLAMQKCGLGNLHHKFYNGCLKPGREQLTKRLTMLYTLAPIPIVQTVFHSPTCNRLAWPGTVTQKAPHPAQRKSHLSGLLRC